ncbi:hypothetical protein BKA66DRAFT_437334 [Pyrenochaeta sp. MPI-SDFR-AT-0127]|nr:hypothetical protein BKA66DRAFT_437334 [Pyrenochaeta sp. MPI-SDFR-AT-0127]
MLFMKKIIFIFIGLHRIVSAVDDSSPDALEELVVLYQEEIPALGEREVQDNGEANHNRTSIITVYGNAEPSTPFSRRSIFDDYDNKRVAKRCGRGEVQCSNDYRANPMVCNELARWMETSWWGVKWEPRAYCNDKPGYGQCCISWADPISGALQSHLASAAYAVLGLCTDFWGDVSGLTRDTQLGNRCTTQCLSNRPKGCR